MLSFSGCSLHRYKVNCDGAFSGLKSSYFAGQTVRFRVPVATDTNFNLYVDGEYQSFDSVENDSMFIYKFRMPAHDITITFSSVNTMLAPERSFEYGDKMLGFYAAETGSEAVGGYYEIIITYYSTSEVRLDTYDTRAGGRELKSSYLVPYEVYEDAVTIAGDADMNNWNDLGDEAEAIDGLIYVCRFADFYGSSFRVTSEKMPADGETALIKLYNHLSAWATSEHEYDFPGETPQGGEAEPSSGELLFDNENSTN